MKTLLIRSKTAVVFVSVMLTGMYLGVYTFSILMFLVMQLSLWEFFKLYKSDLDNSKFKNLYFFFAALIASIAFLQTSPVTISFGLQYMQTALLLSPFILLIIELFSHSERPFQNISLIILPLLYVCLPLCMLNTIIMMDGVFEPLLSMGIILLIWSNDAFAYLVGSAIGKHKIIPRITPGKTWEGTIGGVLCNFIVAYLLAKLFGVFNFQQWTVIAAIVSIFGTLGDWVESMMKRSLSVKDSGDLLPGHGGMLDRFDAFFFAVPFVVVYIYWLQA
jgi:phosphatidate cytidylyltransferase